MIWNHDFLTEMSLFEKSVQEGLVTYVTVNRLCCGDLLFNPRQQICHKKSEKRTLLLSVYHVEAI